MGAETHGGIDEHGSQTSKVLLLVFAWGEKRYYGDLGGSNFCEGFFYQKEEEEEEEENS